jgi:hypothetical protein
MASLGGGNALFFDGRSWLYNLSSNNWIFSAAVTTETSWDQPGMASIGNNKVIAFGGTPLPSQTWLFSAASMPWCDEDKEKVYVCHNGNTICVNANAVPAHLAHGDYVGPCTVNRGEITVEEIPKPLITESAKPGFNIYPNPSAGDFIISLNLAADHSGDRIINIINSNGQVVKQLNMNGQNRVSMNIKDPGTYSVQLITNRQVITKKLIVVH